jgi:Ca2+-binding RTX toxin-like protein
MPLLHETTRLTFTLGEARRVGMRKTVLLLTSATLVLVIAVEIAFAATINGTNGSDRLTGTERSDTINGRKGQDTLRGLGGGDDLLGQLGRDRLVGGEKGDCLAGGGGNDTLEGGPNQQNPNLVSYDVYVFAGPWGDDAISDPDEGVLVFDSIRSECDLRSSGVASDLTISLTPGPGAEVTDGANTVNWSEPGTVIWVDGGSGNDEITGDDAVNFLEGNEGDDTINGGAGDDLHIEAGSVKGGAGNDTLDGGPGRDTVFGNTGDDTINAADGEADEVDCGVGNDRVTFDPGLDFLNRCEEAENGS